MADTVRMFRHFRDVPESLWRWPDFSPAEIACRGTGRLKLHPAALDTLQALRDRLGKPLIVRSAYRSPEHNRAVGGAKRSKHMDGTAFDIAMANHDPVAFEAAAREVGFLGFGYYPRSGFMHVDLGPARSWGDPFPERATPFAAETPPAREVLAESRTLKGTGAAGAATVGAAGVRSRRRCSPRRRARSCRWCPISTHCAGCSSRWRSAGSVSPSGHGSMTGARGGADVGLIAGRAVGSAMGASGGRFCARSTHHRPLSSQPPPVRRARGARRRAAGQPGAQPCHSPQDAGRGRKPPSGSRRSCCLPARGWVLTPRPVPFRRWCRTAGPSKRKWQTKWQR